LKEQSTAAAAVARHNKFPFLDLRAQHATIADETLAAVQRVLESQHFILGAEVEQFEAELAAYLGAQHAIACASGSDALLLALMALEIGAGDEVITSPFTFGATAGAIARLGARPVFVDIDPVTFNIDPDAVAAAFTTRTRAIMPVHLFGLCAHMPALMALAGDRGIAVIEDAAQAIGARIGSLGAGTIGAIGCFSFFPSKNLGGAGDGGLLTTDDNFIAQRLRMLRVHGCRRKYHYEAVGINSRLDALQAAILRVKLPHLDAWTAARRRNAENYRQLFPSAGLDQDIALPVAPPGQIHVYNQYVVRARERDALREYLLAEGIPTEVYYPAPLHTEPAFREFARGGCPNAEQAAREALALPIYPELSFAQQCEVVTAIARFFSRATAGVPHAA